jgi:hypothetical protein
VTALDIANRALQRVGASRIASFSDNSKAAAEIAFNYGKLRTAELQRNTWRFSRKEVALRPLDTNTMLLAPTLWNNAVTYFVGSIVQDANGSLWKSVLPNNLSNQPGLTNPPAWVPYFGPLTVQPFDSSVGYFDGELVYTLKGDGTYNVYLSLTNGNAVHPAMPNMWSATTIYKIDDVVAVVPNWSSGPTYVQGQTVLYTDGNVYSSLTNSNNNNIPPSSPANWALMPTLTLQSQFVPISTFTALAPVLSTPIDEWKVLTSYSIGQFVIFNAVAYLSIANNNIDKTPSSSPSFWVAASGGTNYQSLVDLNLGNTPASSPSQWTSVFSLGGGNSQWIQIGGGGFPNGVGLTAVRLTYPVGSGPLSQSWTKNVYRLPAGFIRRAPQDPKAGIWSWLGAPGNLTQVDWTFESQFLTTWDSRAIILHFIADVQNVTDFDPMFCEALSCRIALEVCETLTQSTAKLSFIAQEYKKFMGEAIIVDLIDVGAEEPPLDDLVACRF